MANSKRYKVVRYFDTYPEAIVKSDLSLDEAEEIAKVYNDKAQHKQLTEYEVRQI